jgi:hypothetical protein
MALGRAAHGARQVAWAHAGATDEAVVDPQPRAEGRRGIFIC